MEGFVDAILIPGERGLFMQSRAKGFHSLLGETDDAIIYYKNLDTVYGAV